MEAMGRCKAPEMTTRPRCQVVRLWPSRFCVEKIEMFPSFEFESKTTWENQERANESMSWSSAKSTRSLYRHAERATERLCNHSILPANMIRSRWRAGTRVACLSRLRKSVGSHLDHSSQLSYQPRQYHDGIQPVHWKRDTAILAYTGQRYQQVDIFLHTITSTLTSTSTLQPVSVSGGLVPSCTSVSPVTIVATQVDRVIAPAASRTLVPFCTAYLYEYGTAAGTTVSNAALCASKATPPHIAAQWYSVTYAPTSTQSWCSIFSTVYQEQWYSGWSMYTALTAVGTPAVSVT